MDSRLLSGKGRRDRGRPRRHGVGDLRRPCRSHPSGDCPGHGRTAPGKGRGRGELSGTAQLHGTRRHCGHAGAGRTVRSRLRGRFCHPHRRCVAAPQGLWQFDRSHRGPLDHRRHRCRQQVARNSRRIRVAGGRCFVLCHLRWILVFGATRVGGGRRRHSHGRRPGPGENLQEGHTDSPTGHLPSQQGPRRPGQEPSPDRNPVEHGPRNDRGQGCVHHQVERQRRQRQRRRRRKRGARSGRGNGVGFGNFCRCR
mmetsp:Transcript_8346/g.24679  ORF Transcript_8346/g.24679 Transcript_8346/m.24679 type:complete len:254 (-) Transcript_8346:577-1338(-)